MARHSTPSFFPLTLPPIPPGLITLLHFLLLVGTILLISALVTELRRPRNLPPHPEGARPLPFIGHSGLLPREKSWIKFRQWHETDGRLLSFWEGDKLVVLVGDAQVASDLMEARSSKYSSRPRFVLAGDILSQNKGILFAPYGERWRAYRRALHLGTMPKTVEGYKPIMEMEGKVLASDLVRDPADWYQLIQRYVASAVVAAAYGRRIIDTRTDSAYQKLAGGIEFLIKINVPGAQWLETFPFLAHIPAFLLPLKAAALKYRSINRQNTSSLMSEVRTKLQSGTAPHSFARLLLEQRDKFSDLDDVEFNNQAGSFFGAGVDTTSATLQTLVLALVSFPEVQKRAQDELDEVVGDERSPTWDDEARLPYVCAVVKETLRWRPVAILGGTPHASTEDDWYEYKGKKYFIPNGSEILAPLWSIHTDPAVYEDPDKYDPGRFMGDKVYPATGSRGTQSFGWGRRVCPGAYFAERSLFLTTARLLWGFSFSVATDPKTGEALPPDTTMEMGYTAGFNTRPHPFKCRIEPRSVQHVAVIEREAVEAKHGLRAFEGYLE